MDGLDSFMLVAGGHASVSQIVAEIQPQIADSQRQHDGIDAAVRTAKTKSAFNKKRPLKNMVWNV